MVHDNKFGDEMRPEKNRPPFHYDEKLDKAAERVKKILEKEEAQSGNPQEQVCTA